MGLVLNRVRDSETELDEHIAQTGLKLFGVIPEDNNITRFDMQAKPLLQLPDNSPAVMAAKQILANL